MLAPLYPIPKASGLDPGCEWGLWEVCESPFPPLGSAALCREPKEGTGAGETPISPLYQLGAYSAQC